MGIILDVNRGEVKLLKEDAARVDAKGLIVIRAHNYQHLTGLSCDSTSPCNLSFQPASFINRVFDLQAFTATIFLLLTSYRTKHGSSTFSPAMPINVTTDWLEGK